MNSLKNVLGIIILLLFLNGCETPFVPDTKESEQQYVVEGFVEAGEGAFPTYVIITKSIPFIGEVGPDAFSNLFVHEAVVTVHDGDKEVVLQELCLDNLPKEIRDQLAATLGFDPDSTSVNFCAYVDIVNQVTQEEGRTYSLNIDVDGTHLSAVTTIPTSVPLFNLTWEDPPGDPNDTLATLKVTIDDPGDEENFYRYFTASDGDPLVSPLASVVNDALYNGLEFEFPLNKAIPRNTDIDINTFGLWTRGDTITLKWCTIDEAHYEFWHTFDFNNNNQGPFSSYTRVDSNVEGALGVWGGYAVNIYNEVVIVK